MEFALILFRFMLKVFLFDIDGVLTNGRKLYDQSGFCVGKEFCDKDFTVLKRLKARGVECIAITGDPWNEEIMLNRRIKCINSRNKNKEDFLPIICKDYSVTPSEIAYIGDDLFDVGLLKAVGYAYCPKDAVIECAVCSYQLSSCGGENVLSELIEDFRDQEIIPCLSFKEEYQKILDLDKLERF